MCAMTNFLLKWVQHHCITINNLGERGYVKKHLCNRTGGGVCGGIREVVCMEEEERCEEEGRVWGGVREVCVCVCVCARENI